MFYNIRSIYSFVFYIQRRGQKGPRYYVIDEKKIIFFEALDSSVTCQLVLIVNRPLSIETSRKRHPIFVPPVLLDFAIYATWYKTTR